MGGQAETLEQLYVPGLIGRQRNVVVATDALEDVFDAVVELGKKGGSGGFLTDCWLSTSHVPPQCQQFVYRRLQRFEIDGDFLTKFSGFHSSTLPRRSMRRVKRVGGERNG